MEGLARAIRQKRGWHPIVKEENNSLFADDMVYVINPKGSTETEWIHSIVTEFTIKTQRLGFYTLIMGNSMYNCIKRNKICKNNLTNEVKDLSVEN